MPSDYLPILIFLILASLFGVIALVVPALLGPQRPSSVKLKPYESGKIPYGDAWRKIPIHYYKVSMLFILFDLEVVFLYPWAVLFRRLKLFGLIEMGVFVLILLVGYIYVWKKGALEWE
jgi:NADH-quinone oxidoreductase subunit A